MATCLAVMPCSSVAPWSCPALRRRGRVRPGRKDIFARHAGRSRSWNTTTATNWIFRLEPLIVWACMSRATSFGVATKSHGCPPGCAPNITKTDHKACSIPAVVVYGVDATVADPCRTWSARFDQPSGNPAAMTIWESLSPGKKYNAGIGCRRAIHTDAGENDRLTPAAGSILAE